MKNQLQDFPLDIKISFHKIIEHFKSQVETEQSSIAKNYKQNVLEYVSSFPLLEEGIDDPADLRKLQDPIRILLNDLFSPILTNNEIKAASLPFHNIIFNASKRFRNILENAGDEYKLTMRNMDENMNYIYGCILILNHHYNYKIDFSRPLYYDIPNEDGILKHYRLALNADFIDIFPGENARDITEKDVDLLLQNIDDIGLWREMFLPEAGSLKVLP